MSTLHNHVSSINNNLSNISNNNNNNNNINQQSSPLAAGSSSPSVTTGSPSLSNNINNNNSHPHQPTTGNVGHPSDSSFSNIVNNNSNNSSHTTPSTTTSTAATTGGGGGILGAREVSSAKKFLPLFARSMMLSSSVSSSSSAQPADTASAMAAADGTAGTSSGPATSATSGSATSGATGGGRSFPIPDVLNVVLHGYQRKLKTNKKKYFVVYGDTPDKFARLEYFDSEKKFKQSFAKLVGGMGGGGGGSDGGPVAKRSIVLRSCFNINKRHDTKKHIISLFTKDDCFCIVFESDDEMNRWLRTLLRLQRGEESEGDPPKPTFEHVWDVFVQRKGLGDSYGILGTYRLCITDKILSLVRIGPELTTNQEKRAETVEFSLASIRRCGHSQRYFYLEVGRSSKTGAGEIWMELQDSIIAQNMYTTIMKSAKSKEDNLGPMIRIRSSSANAASKPTSTLFRRQTHAGQKPMNCSPSSEEQCSQNAGSAQNSESSSSAASINTVVLVGSPPNSKARPVAAVATPNLPPTTNTTGCADKLLATSITSSATTSTTSTTTTTISTTSTTITTTTTTSTTSTATPTASTTASPMVSNGSAVSPYAITTSVTTTNTTYSAATIVPFAGISGAVGTPAPIACVRSSNSSLASIGSGSPIDAYVPLVPGAGSISSNPIGGGDGGGGGSVSGRGHIGGSPRLGVTAQSPSYRRASLKKTPSEGGSSGVGLVGKHPHPHHHHHHHLHHGPVVPLLPPSSANHHHHHHLLHHQHHQHGAQQTSSSAGSATLPRPNPPGSSSSSLGSVCTSSISSSGTSSGISSSTSGTNTVPVAAAATATIATDISSSSTDHGVAIARERCDSLPSRNRTTSETMPHQQQQHQQQQHVLQQQHSLQHQLMLNSGGMPPPRMIPSNNRPHSMHISSCHGHSPPVNSSPLSPPPATYSTGSDGSSYSIDESTDSFITDPPTPDEGNGYKVINHLNSGGSIPEENSEEFIKDYGHIDLRLGGGLSQHDEYGGVQTHFRMSPQSDGKPSNYSFNHHHSHHQNNPPNHQTSTISARLGHSHHNSLSLPISQAGRRGGSPAPPSTVGSVEGSAYMEMCSPSGSSPGDPSGSCYMAMSPVADFSRGLCSSSSAHSRASSLAEDLVDGYVPMSMPRTAAQPPTEEYVSMDPTQNGTSSRLSNATSGGGGGNGGAASGIGGMSSAASSCSITSGTPSTDLRLSLEKVPAYIGQSDEGEVNDRPYRTYSVGSRPEHIKRKLRIDMLSSAEGGLGAGGSGSGGGSASSRQRAFSVGSRAKVPRCSEMYKGYSQAPVIVSFVSSSSQGSVTESNNNSGGSTSSIPHVGSFGATLEPNLPLDESAVGRAGSGSLLAEWKPPFGGGATSHGSFDQMADLMEIDYSSPRNGDEAGNSSSTPLKRATNHELPGSVIPGMEDYLDMSGSSATSGNNNLNNNNHHHQHHLPSGNNLDDERERAVANAHALAGYVEMRPGGGGGTGGSRLNSQSEEGDYLNMTPGVPNVVPGRTDEDVVDGPLGGGSGSAKSTSNPIQISSPKKYNNGATASTASSSSGMDGSAGKNNNYLDMYPRMLAKATSSGAALTATKVPSEDYLNMTPLMMMSSVDSGSEEKMLLHGGNDEESAVVVGGAAAATTGTASSMDTASSSSAPDGYMEMSFNHNTTTQAGSNAMPPSEDDYMNMSFGTTATPSQVIPSAPITITPGAGKCRLDLSGESKVEASSNIPNYLPLGHHHHNHHHHSNAGKSSSHVLSSATIVSLQQPVQTTTGQQSGSVGFSPSKGVVVVERGGVLRARCDSRDSGIVTPSGSQATIFPFSPGSPTKPFPPANNNVVVEVAKQTPPPSETLEDLSQNYAELSLGRGQQSIPGTGSGGGEASSVMRKLSTGSRSSGTFPRSGALASPGVVQPDYVNFCPVGPVTPDTVVPTPQPTVRSRIEDDGAGDYALMNPASARKQSTTSMGGSGGAGTTSPTGSSTTTTTTVGGGTTSSKSSSSPPVLVAKKSTFLSNPQMGFKPIASSQDAELHTKVLNCTASSPKAHFARRLDGVATAFSFEQAPSSSSQPPLQRSLSGTRPNSVNSELIGGGGGRGAIAMLASSSTPTSSAPGTSRPNSANSERLPIISATSSSASSTSTLCESKNQSPSASCTAIAVAVMSESARPDSVSSVTDPHIISRPPSVSSERELHYASLDLPPCSSKTVLPAVGIGQPPSAAAPSLLASTASNSVQKMDVDEPLPGSNEARYAYETMSSTSSPSPGCTSQQQQQQQPVRCGGAFTYAQIDFVRSQAPKQQQQQPVTGGPGSSAVAGSSGAGSSSSAASPQSSQA